MDHERGVSLFCSWAWISMRSVEPLCFSTERHSGHSASSSWVCLHVLKLKLETVKHCSHFPSCVRICKKGRHNVIKLTRLMLAHTLDYKVFECLYRYRLQDPTLRGLCRAMFQTHVNGSDKKCHLLFQISDIFQNLRNLQRSPVSSVKLTKTSKAGAILVSRMSDRWPTSSRFWVQSLCQKLGQRAKHVRETFAEINKSWAAPACLFCLLTVGKVYDVADLLIPNQLEIQIPVPRSYNY